MGFLSGKQENLHRIFSNQILCLIILANFIYTGFAHTTGSHMKIISILLASAVLTACTTPPQTPPAQDAQSAQLLSTAIKRAEGASKGTASADAKPRAAQMAGGQVSISFAGEAKDLLRQMSATRAVTFRVRGPEPHLPLFVIVDVQNVSLEEFLADVGAQFGQRADLVLTDTSIEVRYRD
jgi:hypothetical protein